MVTASARCIEYGMLSQLTYYCLTMAPKVGCDHLTSALAWLRPIVVTRPDCDAIGAKDTTVLSDERGQPRSREVACVIGATSVAHDSTR